MIFYQLPGTVADRENVGIQDIARLKETVMPEGFYKIEFAGPAGTGSGVIVLMKGRVAGTDGGADYNGTYALTGTGGQVRADIRCTIHPGAEFVMGGGPQFYARSFSVTATFPAAGSGPITVTMPPGSPPVTAGIRYLRGLP
jgi:hypothetical protein